MTIRSSNIGYPRIGENREWKQNLELYWAGEIDEGEFSKTMETIRLSHLRMQKDKGIDLIPIGDFSYYDHVLDTAVMFGLIPERFRTSEQTLPLSTYFEIARGSKGKVASEMTKWFNTNYHYIVPELHDVQPKLTDNRLLNLYKEARDKLGINGKPVLVGPITLLSVAKGCNEETRSELVHSLVPLYIEVLKQLDQEGAEWIQIDEPILVKNISQQLLTECKVVYSEIASKVPNLKLILQTYFESIEFYEEVIQLPVKGIGLDFVADDGINLSNVLEIGFPSDKVLFAGIIDGRNIWKSNLTEKAKLIESLKSVVAEDRLYIQPSCSLLHVPVSTKNENELEDEVLAALSFADEKLGELSKLTKVLNKELVDDTLLEHDKGIRSIKLLQKRNVKDVHDAIANIHQYPTERIDASKRKERFEQRWNLPLLPTTTIGSFPQTKEVRKQRLKWRKGELTNQQYNDYINAEIKKWISVQEELGLDVFVHGEFERTDMVEFFGEKLEGFVKTRFGWVQSYGSRCVKPPVIFGDVNFKEPMTIKETVYAQSLTQKPVKGMLTGPVTILNWSFVRDDISRVEVLSQIGLAIRKEVLALESEGIGMIQVDEPALREGLPLKQEKKDKYLSDAVRAFKLSTSSVKEDTQIHTHMCYSNFDDIIYAIDALDADVISIETSRSHGGLIQSFEKHQYQKGIGLGVYDIHSPRVPSLDELTKNIERALEVLDHRLFWVNPDCGLKTRGYQETVDALEVMVEAAKSYRLKLEKMTLIK